MNTIPTSFETERLLLRRTLIEDASFILELLNTPKWKKFIGDRGVNTLEDAEEYIREKIFTLYDTYGYGNFTVVRKSDNAIIGNCGLYNRKGIDGVDIGFAFLPEFEGKGYGFESASKVKELAITYYNIDTIYAITAKRNLASQSLLEKLGLQFDSFLRLPNEDEELKLYKFTTNS